MSIPSSQCIWSRCPTNYDIKVVLVWRSARGNWVLGKANNHFDPNKIGDNTTTLRQLLIGAAFSVNTMLDLKPVSSSPGAVLPALSGGPTPNNTASCSLDSSSLYISTAPTGPSSSPNAMLRLPHSRLQISCSPAHFVSPLSLLSVVLGCFSIPPASLTSSGFFNGMLKISKPGALNCYTLSRLILLTLFTFRNPTLTHLPLSRSVDSLLCDLITLTPSLPFFPNDPHTSSGIIISVRQCLSFSKLSTSSFHLTPTLMM